MPHSPPAHITHARTLSHTCTYDAHTHVHVHTCTHVRAHPELRLFCFLVAGPWRRLCPSQQSALSSWIGVGALPSLPLSTWGANWPPSLGPVGNSLFWVCPSQYQRKAQARGVLPGAMIRESLLWPNPGHFLGFCDGRLPWPALSLGLTLGREHTVLVGGSQEMLVGWEGRSGVWEEKRCPAGSFW